MYITLNYNQTVQLVLLWASPEVQSISEKGMYTFFVVYTLRGKKAIACACTWNDWVKMKSSKVRPVAGTKGAQARHVTGFRALIIETGRPTTRCNQKQT